MREVSHKPASNRIWSINDPGIAPLQSVAQGALGNTMQSVRRKYRSRGFQKFSQRAAQRISDLLERLDGGLRLTRLEQGNCRLRQPGPLRQIGLSQASALTRPAAAKVAWVAGSRGLSVSKLPSRLAGRALKPTGHRIVGPRLTGAEPLIVRRST
jgi:hypothetical protein